MSSPLARAVGIIATAVAILLVAGACTSVPSEPTPTLAEPTTTPATGTPLGAQALLDALLAKGYLYTAPANSAYACGGGQGQGATYSAGEGPAFDLWVYPSTDALAAEWSTATGEPQFTGGNCFQVPSPVYVNANLVLFFRPPAADSAAKTTILDAFRSLSP